MPAPAVVEIKFCGLTREADVAVAAALGATYVGAIFAGGPRELTPARAAEVLAAAGASVRRVGVFGFDFRSRIPATVAQVPLDIAQLHGDPSPADVAAAREVFNGQIWAVVRVRGAEVPAGAAALFDVANAVLFDPKVAERLGGTGQTLDWTSVGPAIQRSRGVGGRVVLAGGLTPDNVADAITAIRPAVVDVSSGVESTPGVKDHARMAAFTEAVRRSNR